MNRIFIVSKGYIKTAANAKTKLMAGIRLIIDFTPKSANSD